MAKVTLTSITAGYAPIAALNDNFQAIADELENTLSRDGTSPNMMNANLDMNSFRIINLPEPINASEAARLADVTAALSGGAANLISFTPAGNIAANTVQGAIEELDTEKLADSSVSTFMKTVLDDTNAGDAQTTLGGTTVGKVLFTAASEAAARDAISAEREFMVNVKDHGAMGDDSTDDTAAIQAAIDVVGAYAAPYGGVVFFPRGIYRVSNLDVTGLKNVRFVGESGAGGVVVQRGAILRADLQTVSGKAVFDLTSTLDTVLEGIQITALTAAGAAPSIVPTFGFMLAEGTAGDSNRITMRNCTADGHFTKAAFGMRCMSNNHFEHCSFMCRSTGGYAGYMGSGTTVVFASEYKTITSTGATSGNTFTNVEWHGRFDDATAGDTVFLEDVRTFTFTGGLIDGSSATGGYIRAKGDCENVTFIGQDYFASLGGTEANYGLNADASATLDGWQFIGCRINDLPATEFFHGGSGATAKGLSLIGVHPSSTITGNLLYFAAKEQIVFGASSGVSIAAGANRDIGLGSAVSANPGQVIRKMHAPGILCNMQSITDGNPGAGQTYTFTLYRNLAAQSLAAVQSDTSTSGEDITNSVLVARGDTIFVKGVGSAGAGANNSAQITIGFIPTS